MTIIWKCHELETITTGATIPTETIRIGTTGTTTTRDTGTMSMIRNTSSQSERHSVLMAVTRGSRGRRRPPGKYRGFGY